MYDVIIVGLGAMGSAAAYHLARRGLRVLGLERHTAGHDQGSSHGHSRIIRLAYFEDPAYVPLLLRAYELWRELEAVSDESLLTITGGLMIGRPESRTVSVSDQSAALYGIRTSRLDAAEIRRRYPPLRVPDGMHAILDHDAGFLVPERCVQTHLRLADANGADLRFGTSIIGWSASSTGEGVTVTTAEGTYSAARLIVSAGAWAPTLLNGMQIPLTILRKVLYWFDPVAGVEDFHPDRFPVYLWEDEGMQFYGFPAQSGAPGGVKVAFHSGGTECTPATIDRAVQATEIDEMRAAIAERIPSLNGPLRATTTCMYTQTPDGHFVIAAHPEYPQAIIASPCSGHGFKFAAVMGEILADLAQTGHTRHPIELFDPARFA